MGRDVGMDVGQAAVLVRALEQAAADLERSAADIRSLTEFDCGVDYVAREVRDTAEWCRRRAGDVRRRAEHISQERQRARAGAVAAYMRPFGERPRDTGAILDQYQRCATGAPCRWEVEQELAEVDYDLLIHGLLDVAGLLPAVGEPADAWNAKLYWDEGARDDAVISAAGIVAGLGDFAKGGRLARAGGGRRLFELKKYDRTAYHPRFGVFYRNTRDGYWWVKDRAGHGGSAWKLYEDTSAGLKWVKDADEYGKYLEDKHKSNIGAFIPWKEFAKR